MRIRSKGMSLVSVLVTTTIAGIIGLAVISMLTNAFKSQKFSQMKDDIQLVRRSLSQSLKCAQSIPNPAVCDGVTPILLKDGSNQPITQALETTGPLTGSGKFGDYYVKATCSNADKTLTLSVARVQPDGTFARDPLSQREFDFNRPPNPLFGKNNPMCQEVLGGSSGGQTCPAYQVMIGIRSDGSLNCVPIPQVMPVPRCPVHQVMLGVNADGSASCSAPAIYFMYVPWATMTALHPGCSPMMPYPACIAAANRYCVARGYVSGFAVESAGGFIAVVCVGIP